MISLETENRNGYIVPSSMKKVWAVQIDLLQKLLDVCKRHGLQIWADGGTLLGTVREHGYIPWDDDIDMLMLREDYDRLVSISEKEFTHPYFFQCAHTEKGYFRGHAQLRYDGTAAILPYDVNQSFHQGIFIDIFVYDEIPDVEDENWKNTLEDADRTSHILWKAKYPVFSIFHPIGTIDSIKSKIYFHRHGGKKLFDDYEEAFRSFNGKGYKRIACPCFNRNIFKTATKMKEWYSGTVWMTFEGMKMPVPEGYDNVLRTQYGDSYMTPRQSGSIHGGFLAIDAERPFTELLPDLKRQVRKKIWKNRLEKIFRINKDKQI